jgi:hypothetical protein
VTGSKIDRHDTIFEVARLAERLELSQRELARRHIPWRHDRHEQRRLPDRIEQVVFKAIRRPEVS